MFRISKCNVSLNLWAYLRMATSFLPTPCLVEGDEKLWGRQVWFTTLWRGADAQAMHTPGAVQEGTLHRPTGCSVLPASSVDPQAPLWEDHAGLRLSLSNISWKVHYPDDGRHSFEDGTFYSLKGLPHLYQSLTTCSSKRSSPIRRLKTHDLDWHGTCLLDLGSDVKICLSTPSLIKWNG